MAKAHLKSTTFTRNLVWLAILLPIAAISFWLYVQAEKEIGHANNLRYQSFLLADELHQSSDDLTRMVRTYVATGNPIYKHYYQDILDIRDGRLPRPEGYTSTFWDLAIADPSIHLSNGSRNISLLELMRQSGFTQSELEKLVEAKNQSELLTRIEYEAMRLAETTGRDSAANHAKARLMLYDEQYHQAKSKIMAPISAFHQILDQRTIESVTAAESKANRYRLVFVLIGFAVFWRLQRTHSALRDEMGGTVDQVRSHITRIGSGDLSQPISVPSEDRESVLGWLVQMQDSLKSMQLEREVANAKLQRITHLYAALSQCNQAIVRCTNETELFPQICRDVVTYGGMQMAWIGLVDKSTKLVKPVSAFGVGIEYLDGIEISIDSNDPKGRGPTGIALRENRPYWCQDFQHAPETSAWHERGASFGWRASASLPILRKGFVVGAFTLYASEVDTFDEAAQNLLVEMAMDISYALDRFEDTVQQEQMQIALQASGEIYRATFNQAAVGIARVSPAGVFIEVNKRIADIVGYSQSELMALSFQDITYPDDLDVDLANVDKMLMGDIDSYSMEKRYLRKSGEVLWVNLTVALARNPDGSPKYFISVVEDINARKQGEMQLRKMTMAVEQSPTTIVITDLDANIEYANTTFTKVTGYTLEEALGKNPRILQSGQTPKATYDDMWAHLTAGKEWHGELINRRKDGSEYIESAIISPIRQADGKITNYLAIKQDITAKRRDEERIEQLAHFDVLTDLPNRSLLNERFSYALSLAQRSGEQMAVMFLDIDHFKNINDTLGHSVGDKFLIEVAHRLKATLREEDTVSRLGGDEFILVFPGTDADAAAIIANKLIQAVSQAYQIEQHELIGTPSIGIAIYPDDGDNFEDLLKNADTAMYRVKQDSRNDFRFFTTEMQSHSERNLQLVNAMRHALARNEFHLQYQPQVTLRDGHIIGAEALLRWQHPELGAVSPAEFIPIAEDSGQIIPIGEWVLRTAVKQMKDWLDSDLPPMVIAVNLSAVQFRQPNLPELVTRILEEAQLSPEYLELELTEAVAMDDPQAAISVMDKLFDRGIHMSIDDFGTGYSSLSYLKRFKVYKLKIDQSFVRDISDDPEDKAIVTAIINLASSLGMHTIAEGVETASQLAFLRLQGCGEVQGYYFSKPLHAEDFDTFVRKPR